MSISVVIPSRNRIESLSANLGNFVLHQDVSEVIIVDNSDKPYTDSGNFRMLVEMYYYCQIRLKVIPFRGQTNPARLRLIGATEASCEHVLFWDDDNILVTSLKGYRSRLGKYGQMGFCCQDVINYYGFPDWIPAGFDPANPDHMKLVYHPTVMSFRWFNSNKYSKFETPWGVGGLALMNRDEWLNNVDTNAIMDWPYGIPCEDVHFNVKFLHKVGKKAVVHFHDKTTHLRFLGQGREWIGGEELLKNNKKILLELQTKYIKDKKLEFV